MNYLPFILGSISIAGLFGALALFFKKGGDKEASALDQNTIRAYRDSEAKLKDEASSLRAQLQTKDDIIERLIRNGKDNKKSQR